MPDGTPDRSPPARPIRCKAVEHLETTIDLRDGRALVAVKGEIDGVSAGQLRAVLETATSGAGRVEIDLRETTFMDSSGLAVLLAAHQRLGGVQEAIVLIQPRASVRRLLEITGVDAVFDVRDTEPRPLEAPEPAERIGVALSPLGT